MLKQPDNQKPSNVTNFYLKVSSFSTGFLKRKRLVDQQIELRIGTVQRLSQGKGRTASLAVNIAIAGRNTRASRREKSRATFQPYGVTK